MKTSELTVGTPYGVYTLSELNEEIETTDLALEEEYRMLGSYMVSIFRSVPKAAETEKKLLSLKRCHSLLLTEIQRRSEENETD